MLDINKVFPTEDRVLCKMIEIGEQQVGRIIIPGNIEHRQYRALVIRTGPGALQEDLSRKPMGVKAGDVVVFGKYSGHDINIHTERYVMLKESEILGVLQED